MDLRAQKEAAKASEALQHGTFGKSPTWQRTDELFHDYKFLKYTYNSLDMLNLIQMLEHKIKAKMVLDILNSMVGLIKMLEKQVKKCLMILKINMVKL